MKKLLPICMLLFAFASCRKNEDLQQTRVLLKKMVSYWEDGSWLSTIEFQYDNKGRITQYTHLQDAGTTHIIPTYDVQGKLTGGSYTYNNESWVEQCTYDAADRPLTCIGQSSTATLYKYLHSYQDNVINIDHYLADGSLYTKSKFVYDNKGNIASARTGYDRNNYEGPETTYEQYDSKKSYEQLLPFTEISLRRKANANNPLKQVNYYNNTETIMYTYIYNEHDYPTEQRASINGQQPYVKARFEYITINL